jgi:hypothetical protein
MTITAPTVSRPKLLPIAGLGETHAEAIGAATFALGTVICTVWGTVLANDTATSTRVVLAGGHLIAAAVVVPIIRAAVAAGRK